MIDKICKVYRHELTEIIGLMNNAGKLINLDKFGYLLDMDGCVADFRKQIEYILSVEKAPNEKPIAIYDSTLPTDYDPTEWMTREEAVSAPQPVCVLIDADGNPQGVLVRALGERFVVEPKDFNDGEEMTWDEAMSALKEAGKTTFNKRLSYIILFLLENINAALLSIGGDELSSSRWAAAEYNSSNAWFVNFGSGYFGYTNKYNSDVVRAVAAF